MMSGRMVFVPLLFAISYVYCAREVSNDLAETYGAENCAMLDYNKSVIMWTNIKLNAICKKTEFAHLIPTDETPPVVIRRLQINIVEMEYDYVLIAYYGSDNSAGNAKLHFESFFEALLFSKLMFSRKSNSKLEHVCRTAKIYRFANDSQLHKTASAYADLWFDKYSKPTKFIVKSDGQTYPSLVFSKGQFEITIAENPGKQVLLEFKDKCYVVYFELVEDAIMFGHRLGALSGTGSLKRTANPF